MASVKQWWLAYPYPYVTPATNTVNLNGSGVKYGFVFPIEETATITHAGVLVNTITGSSPVYRLGIQALTTGLPDTTNIQSGTFTPTANWNKVALSSSYSATRSTPISLIMEHSSGTIDGSNFAGINSTIAQLGPREGRPYAVTNTGSGWARAGLSLDTFLTYALYSSTRCYGHPCKSIKTTAVSSDGNRMAVAFTMPLGSCLSYKVSAIRYYGTTPTTGSSIIGGIWSSTGSMVTKTVSTDEVAASNSTQRAFEVWFGDTVPTLYAGTTYYFGFERSGTNFSVQSLEVADALDLTAYGDQDWNMATYNGSAWSRTTTERPFISLYVEDMTGGNVHRGATMAGGFAA